MEYCLLEVTCDDGEQYGIQAFGGEAEQLHKEGIKRSQAFRKEEQAAVSMVL
jgi:hypothetical protein